MAASGVGRFEFVLLHGLAETGMISLTQLVLEGLERLIHFLHESIGCAVERRSKLQVVRNR